jgi:hypothetical protein
MLFIPWRAINIRWSTGLLLGYCAVETPRDARVIACDQQIGDDPNIVLLEHYFTWIGVHPGVRKMNEGVEDFGR